MNHEPSLSSSIRKQLMLSLSRDAKDDHYLSLCKEIGTAFLITGDNDLLNIPQDTLKKAGIKTRIVNPHEFLEEETEPLT